MGRGWLGLLSVLGGPVFESAHSLVVQSKASGEPIGAVHALREGEGILTQGSFCFRSPAMAAPSPAAAPFLGHAGDVQVQVTEAARAQSEKEQKEKAVQVCVWGMRVSAGPLALAAVISPV